MAATPRPSLIRRAIRHTEQYGVTATARKALVFAADRISPSRGDLRRDRLYNRWFHANRISKEEAEAQRNMVGALPIRPVVSFVIPTWRSDVEILAETVQSVLDQTYPHWQLCIADGGSEDPELRAMLADLPARDDRIRVILLEENLGITGNSNAALTLATGDFIAILDHDDLLEPNMLYEVAQCVGGHPDADVVYFDEDKVDVGGGMYFEPLFKPDWSPEMLLSSNYLMHSVFRRSLVTDVGGFAASAEGSQDWDLAFKVMERSTRIHHVPRVLYHWRAVPTSTAHSAEARPWVYRSQEAAISDHLRRQGIDDPVVDAKYPGLITSRWSPPPGRVAIIHAGTSLRHRKNATADEGRDVVWVDARSRDSRALASEALHAAVDRVRPDFLVVLPTDVSPQSEEWLDELLKWFYIDGVGCSAGQLTDGLGRLINGTGVVREGDRLHRLFQDCYNHYSMHGSTTSYRNAVGFHGLPVAFDAAGIQALQDLPDVDVLETCALWLSLRTHIMGRRNVYDPVPRFRASHHLVSKLTARDARALLPVMQDLAHQCGEHDPYGHTRLDFSAPSPLPGGLHSMLIR